MAICEKPVKYHEKDLLDRTIDQVLSQNNDLTQADLNTAYIAAQLQNRIEQYRAAASAMTGKALKCEEHNSALLGKLLETNGEPRPPRCHAHAIVAGKHEYAAPVRLVMAKLGIRIDDPDNGCWLPENTAATPHPVMPRAVPHSRIHRYNYFFWIRRQLEGLRQEVLFRQELKEIAQQLQEGTFPIYVMLKKGQGLPDEGALA